MIIKAKALVFLNKKTILPFTRSILIVTNIINMQTIQIISIIGSISFIILILSLINKKILKEAYAIIWLIFGFVFLFFSCWRKVLDYISEAIGIYYPPAMLFLLLILAIIMVLIQNSVIISKQNDQIRTLTQEIALIKEKINKNN